MRVLCINGDFSNAGSRMKYLVEVPIQLEEYIVKEIIQGLDKVGYILEGISGGILPSGREVSFDSSRFISLDDLSTLEEETVISEEWNLQEIMTHFL